MTKAEQIWREKSDEDLLDAAAELDQFTDEGQQIIRAELKRRGLEDPLEQAGVDSMPAEQEPLECLRCRTALRLLDTDGDLPPSWRLLGQRFPFADLSGLLDAYVCPGCGHVELFTNVPDDK